MTKKEDKMRSIGDLIMAEQSIQRAYQWSGKDAKSYLDVALVANRFAQDCLIRRLPKKEILEKFPYLKLRYGGDMNEA